MALVIDYFTSAIYAAGSILAILEDYQGAWKLFAEALPRWPDNIQLKIDAAHACARLDEHSSAIALLESAEALLDDATPTAGLDAAERSQRRGAVLAQLAWTYNDMGLKSEAAAAAERALENAKAEKELALARES